MDNILNGDTVISISHETGERFIDKAHTDPIHGICRGVLIRSLTSLGIRVEGVSKKRNKGGDVLEDDNATQVGEFINKYWKDIIYDIIFYGTTLGYFVYTLIEVPIVTQEGKKSFIKKPFILPHTFYDVDIVITKDYNFFYGVKKRNTSSVTDIKLGSHEKYEDNLYCFVIPGYEPSKENGRLKSVVAMSFQSSIWIDQLYDSQVKAHLQRSHPPIIIEESGSGNAAESNLLELEKLNTELGAVQAKSAQNNTEAKYDSINESQNFYMRLGGDVGGHSPLAPLKSKLGGGGGNSYFVPTPVDNIFPLPQGFKMATQPALPEPQADLLNYDANRRREVCSLYGIPPSSIVSDPKSKGGNSSSPIDDNDNLALQRSLHYWQGVLKSFLTEVYLRIRQDLNGNSDVKITIPIIPYTSTGKIHEFVDRNIIGTDKGKEYVAAIAGLSVEDILEGENEHLVPPIHGNENQTTPVIKAKIEVMKAEAAERRAKAQQAKEGEGENGEQDAELLDKEAEFEKMQHDNKMELLDKQMQVEKVKAGAALQKASAQVKVNKSVKKN